MDGFMEKLSGRLNAQDMIKTNMEAEAKENEKLRMQVAAYKECLDRLEKIALDPESGFGSSKGLDDATRSIEEALGNQAVQNERRFQEMGNLINELRAQIQNISLKDENDAAESERLSEIVKNSITSKLDENQDFTHKECVKVYRNVQATVETSCNKLKEAINSASGGNSGLGMVKGLLVITMLASLAGIAFQVLLYLKLI
ncbi:MAG: hypothetical protein K6F84_07340 [Lachnospiraceae bacterium]|nr:hypothetical protein [Lachnospiraceae bacterium]